MFSTSLYLPQGSGCTNLYLDMNLVTNGLSSYTWFQLQVKYLNLNIVVPQWPCQKYVLYFQDNLIALKSVCQVSHTLFTNILAWPTVPTDHLTGDSKGQFLQIRYHLYGFKETLSDSALTTFLTTSPLLS